jgi:hypothetical protein
MEPVDRKTNWQRFAQHMEEYVESNVKGKYQGEKDYPDLMWFTDQHTCIWNILKYALRLWRGRGKERDLEKIAHYAEIAWTIKQEKEGKSVQFSPDGVGADTDIS